VKSLVEPERTGWMTKQGGTFKTWKRRWFVLKGDKIYYFKGQTDQDVTGVIELSSKSKVKKDEIKGKNNLFSVSTTNRVYFMYPDSHSDQEAWISEIQKTLDKLSGKHNNFDRSANTVHSTSTIKDISTSKQSNPAGTSLSYSSQPAGISVDVREKLHSARRAVSFISSGDSKILEFWEIWIQSLPPLNEIDNIIVYEISASVDMEKITWRTSGPQHNFIQR
jgi:hypothetical protein